MNRSLLDILKEEDSLMKERDDVRDRIVSLLYTIDDAKIYPNHYKHINIKQYEEEVELFNKREEELDVEIKNERNSIIQYLLRELER